MTDENRRTKSRTIPDSCIGHDLPLVSQQPIDLGNDAIRCLGGSGRHLGRHRGTILERTALNRIDDDGPGQQPELAGKRDRFREPEGMA